MKTALLLIASFLCLANSRAQTHPIEIHPNGRAASVLMTTAEYDSWIANDDFSTLAPSQSLIADIYQKFDDDFDFIFLVLNEDVKPASISYYGKLKRISNNVQGIGINIFDDSANFGSAGKLKSIMQLTQRGYLTMGPSSHELMHNWANYALPSEAVSNFGTGLTSFPLGGHWGFTGGNTKGQLGGFDQNTLVDNGDGSYTVGSFGLNANGGNSIPYSELELYLMGMIPLSGVAPFDGFTTITSLTDNLNGTWTFEATKTSYTPTSLNTLLGNRIPSSATSQKDFKALVVVLTDTPLTTAEWNVVDNTAALYAAPNNDGSFLYNFWEATGGLGTIEMGNLQASVTLGVEAVALNTSRIYPNPASTVVTIENLNIEEISLYNLMGQEMTNFKVNDTSANIDIDVSGYDAGVYFIHIKTNTKLLVEKLIIR